MEAKSARGRAPKQITGCTTGETMCVNCKWKCNKCIFCTDERVSEKNSNHGISGCPYNPFPCRNAHKPIDLCTTDKYMNAQQGSKALFNHDQSITCMSMYGMINVKAWCPYCVLYYHGRLDEIRLRGIRCCTTYRDYVETSYKEVVEKKSLTGHKIASKFGLHSKPKIDCNDKTALVINHESNDYNIKARWAFVLSQIECQNYDAISGTLSSFGVKLPEKDNIPTTSVMYQNVSFAGCVDFTRKAPPTKKRRLDSPTSKDSLQIEYDLKLPVSKEEIDTSILGDISEWVDVNMNLIEAVPSEHH